MSWLAREYPRVLRTNTADGGHRLDKAKLVYILNRNAEGKLFPSSPLEAHKPQAIISAMIGCDVGYDNPLYACLETSYEEADADSTGEAFERAQKVGHNSTPKRCSC